MIGAARAGVVAILLALALVFAGSAPGAHGSTLPVQVPADVGAGLYSIEATVIAGEATATGSALLLVEK